MHYGHSLSGRAAGGGLAPGGAPGVFLITSGQGGALLHDAARGASMEIAAPLIRQSHWDNHVSAPA